MITSCLIKKIPNIAGNYSVQYVEDRKVKVCSFKTYGDAVSYFYFAMCGEFRELHYENSLKLERI